MMLNSCFVRQYVASDIIFEYQMLIQISCLIMLAAIGHCLVGIYVWRFLFRS